jgi:hypothetical protein
MLNSAFAALNATAMLELRKLDGLSLSYEALTAPA